MIKERRVRIIRQTVSPLAVHGGFDRDPVPWFIEQSRAGALRWLLAHADDGVIWGESRLGVLHLSSDAFPEVSPPLRLITLQQARLFGESAELHIWRDCNRWCGRLVSEGEGQEAECFDEAHLLWGSDLDDSRGGFVLLREGTEGLRHAPAVTQDAALTLPLCVTVRHTLDHDPDGQAYVSLSRLVSLGSYEGS